MRIVKKRRRGGRVDISFSIADWAARERAARVSFVRAAYKRTRLRENRRMDRAAYVFMIA